MYRTDKQFMKNPATAPSRIYVGSLSKTVIADDLEGKFKAHGNILGLVLNNGFAFIQFESETEAQSAIRTENGTVLHGRKIVVKQALDRSKPGGFQGNQGSQRQGVPQNQPLNQMQKPGPPLSDTNKNIPPPSQPINKQNNPPQKTPPPVQAPQTKVSPPPANEQDRPIQFQPPDPDPEPQDDNMEDDRPNIRPPGPPQHNSDRGRKGVRKVNQHRGSERGPRGRSNDRNRFHDRYESQNMDMYRDGSYYGMDERDYIPPREILPRTDSYAPSVLDAPNPPEKNDCEIIVVSKALT